MLNEIFREPEAPELSKQEINQITRTVFLDSNPQRADLIFIFGYGPGHTEAHWEKVAKLFEDGYSDKILINGLLDPHVAEPKIPISHQIKESLIKSGEVPQERILVQDKSRNTLEDVIFGKSLLDSKNIFPKSILFISKAHHSSRCYLTLKKYFPDARLFPYTFDAIYVGIVVSKKRLVEISNSKGKSMG